MTAVDTVTVRYRSNLSEIDRLTERLVRNAWSRLNLDDVAAVREAMIEVAELAAVSYGEVGSLLSAEYYEDLRVASQARGRYTASVVNDFDVDEVRSGMGWAVDPLTKDDPATALKKVITVTGTAVAAMSSRTIRENVRNDPEAQGWHRIARAGSCDFCVMLSQRGAVYKRETADFAAHGNCRCTAKPSWDPFAPEVAVGAYVASERTAKMRALDAEDGGRRYENHKQYVASWMRSQQKSLDAFRAELL